jgi:pimeloyl-ACP methyl ester carboxylesterase
VTEFRRVGLSTGVTLNIALAGPEDAPAVILLHGFPESHRTWREIAPRLEDSLRLIMPDQRGFAGSDRPQDAADYRTEKLIGDIFALADTLGLESFALVGHDWGGAIAWPAALRNDPRLKKLAIVNAPHPLIFQKSLIEDQDQRAASQYINWFRSAGAEKAIEAMGLETFFEKVMAAHVDRSKLLEAERQQYLADWSQPGVITSMLNWYRGSKVIVPPPGVSVPIPPWVLSAFPRVEVPTLVIWGMDDTALLPIQLDGLDRLVDDLSIVRLPGVGHFAPWEAPDEVAAALRDFLA